MWLCMQQLGHGARLAHLAAQRLHDGSITSSPQELRPSTCMFLKVTHTACAAALRTLAAACKDSLHALTPPLCMGCATGGQRSHLAACTCAVTTHRMRCRRRRLCHQALTAFAPDTEDTVIMHCLCCRHGRQWLLPGGGGHPQLQVS